MMGADQYMRELRVHSALERYRRGASEAARAEGIQRSFKLDGLSHAPNGVITTGSFTQQAHDAGSTTTQFVLLWSFDETDEIAGIHAFTRLDDAVDAAREGSEPLARTLDPR